MPDLMIVTMEQCSMSQGLLESHIGGYVQQLMLSERNPYESCTCPAFKYGKGKPCKHLRQLESTICTYHEQFDGPPEEPGRCPRCGKPTIKVLVGV